MITERLLPGASLPVSNVVRLHLRVGPKNLELLERWVAAGGRMGLCDAMAYPPGRDGPKTEYVLVWVRENPDPAYMIAPDGFGWQVTDCLRDQPLTHVRSFEAALHFIRPVLPLTVAA